MVLLGSREAPCIPRPWYSKWRKPQSKVIKYNQTSLNITCSRSIPFFMKDLVLFGGTSVSYWSWENASLKVMWRILLWSSTMLVCPCWRAKTVELLWSKYATGASGFPLGVTTLFWSWSSYWSQGMDSSEIEEDTFSYRHSMSIGIKSNMANPYRYFGSISFFPQYLN